MTKRTAAHTRGDTTLCVEEQCTWEDANILGLPNLAVTTALPHSCGHHTVHTHDTNAPHTHSKATEKPGEEEGGTEEPGAVRATDNNMRQQHTGGGRRRERPPPGVNRTRVNHNHSVLHTHHYTHFFLFGCWFFERAGVVV